MNTDPEIWLKLASCLSSIGLMLIICAWCKRFIRIQRSRGTKGKGLSHGMCRRCAKQFDERTDKLIKEQRGQK